MSFSTRQATTNKKQGMRGNQDRSRLLLNENAHFYEWKENDGNVNMTKINVKRKESLLISKRNIYHQDTGM